MKKIIIFSHDDEFLLMLLSEIINEDYKVLDCFLAGNKAAKVLDSYNCRIHLRKFAMSGNNSNLENGTSIDQDVLIKYAKIEQIFNRMCDCIDFNSRQFSGIERRRYFQDLLRYCLTVLNQSIDLVFFTDNPHSPHDVVFAMLCEEKNIPIKILRESHIRGRYFIQDGLFGKLILKNTKKEELVGNPLLIDFPEDVKKFKSSVVRPSYSLPLNFGFRRNHKIAYSKPSFFYGWLGNATYFNFIVTLLKFNFIFWHLIKGFIKKILGLYYQPLNTEMDDTLKIKGKNYFENNYTLIDNKVILLKGILYKKYIRWIYYNIESKEQINKILNNKFVYFPLHYQPEATTYPYGQLYIDQLLALEMLSISIPSDVKILLKEHPDTFNISGLAWVRGAFSRDPDFYSRISKFKNVIVCPLKVDSFELIDKSLFIATITGTTAIEASFRSKGSIVFGSAWFSDFEGIFSCENIDKVRHAINKIMSSDFKISSTDNLNLLKKFSEISIICNRDLSNSVSNHGLKESAKIIVKAIGGQF
jgi:hypothetical protein